METKVVDITCFERANLTGVVKSGVALMWGIKRA